MAVYNQMGTEPLRMKAGATINANTLVKLDSTLDQVIPTAAIADGAIGVVGAAAVTGDWVTVQVFGVAKLTAKSAITVNTQVMPDSGGGGKIATAAGATAVSIGWALEAATADGDVITVLLATPTVKGPANA